MYSKIPRFLIAFVAALLVAPQLWATTVLEFNLAAMTERSEHIFRGTVLDVSEVSVEAGGGTLKAIEYRIRVDESYKGQVAMVKDQPIIEVRMIGSLKQYHAGKSPVAGFPLLRIGGDYLLMVAPVGPIGLTTTMGLGQGAFAVFADPTTRELMALNGFNNASLFKGMSSGLADGEPVSYSALVAQIRSQLGN